LVNSFINGGRYLGRHQLFGRVVSSGSDARLECLGRSLNDHVKELVPVSGLESADLHGEDLNVFHKCLLYVKFSHDLLLLFGDLHFDEQLLHQIIEVVHAVLLAANLVDLPQVSHALARVSCAVAHVRVKEGADVLVVILKTLQDQQTGNNDEYLGVALLQLFREGLVLLRSGFNHLTEVQKLVHLLGVKEVSEALTPGVLEFNQDLNQFIVVFQLRVYNLDVLFVFA